MPERGKVYSGLGHEDVSAAGRVKQEYLSRIREDVKDSNSGDKYTSNLVKKITNMHREST